MYKEIHLQPNTRVLFHIKDSSQYIMTKEPGEDLKMLRVFEADDDGKITMEGLPLGSIFAHDPYIIPNLEKKRCLFKELNPEYFERDPIVDGLIGLAVGDAFGVPFEFLTRDIVRKLQPEDMLGNDSAFTYPSRWSENIPRGSWSDDTSMTIATIHSLINKHGRIDYNDIMSRFVAWWDKGLYCSLDFPFGLGGTIGKALSRYKRGMPAEKCGGAELMDNGNGALMRIFPFSIYCIYNDYNEEDTASLIRQAAGMTHGHEITAMSCFLYTRFLRECIRTRNPSLAYRIVFQIGKRKTLSLFSEAAVKAHQTLFDDSFEIGFDADSIPESGYVVDSLTISIYSILNTSNYEDAIKTAVSFGYDTDTNAAITGSIAGVIYGQKQIPERWLVYLKKKEELFSFGKHFSATLSRSTPSKS